MASILSQIAEEAGVSVSTVSRVLNGESDYNRPFYAERAARIKDIADKLNYQPNLAARAISTGRFGNLALIASASGQGGMPPHLMDGIADCASRHQQMVSIARLSAEEFTEGAKLPTILNSSAADGLLINYTHQWPDELEQVLERQGKPAVWLNVKRKHNCVHFADREATRDACQRLIELGHKRIVFLQGNGKITGPKVHYSSKDRIAGYQYAMKQAGLEPRIFNEDLNYHNAVDSGPLYDLFANKQRPSAIISNAYGEAACAAAMRHGLSVPNDCCIINFNRLSTGTAAGLPIAGLQIPQKELGIAGVNMLLELIESGDKERSAEKIKIPFTREQLIVAPA